MRKTFNYKKSQNEAHNALVETFSSLVNACIEGKSNTKEYKEANAEFTKTFMAECVNAIPDVTFNSIEDVKDPMIHNDMYFIHRFNTILSQAITPVVPAVIASDYDQFYDVTQVGWGDSAKYTVNSNELFVVNDLATGISRGGLQTSYGTEYTVQASKKQIAIYLDWYHVAS